MEHILWYIAIGLYIITGIIKWIQIERCFRDLMIWDLIICGICGGFFRTPLLLIEISINVIAYCENKVIFKKR